MLLVLIQFLFLFSAFVAPEQVPREEETAITDRYLFKVQVSLS